MTGSEGESDVLASKKDFFGILNLILKKKCYLCKIKPSCYEEISCFICLHNGFTYVDGF